MESILLSAWSSGVQIIQLSSPSLPRKLSSIAYDDLHLIEGVPKSQLNGDTNIPNPLTPQESKDTPYNETTMTDDNSAGTEFWNHSTPVTDHPSQWINEKPSKSICTETSASKHEDFDSDMVKGNIKTNILEDKSLTLDMEKEAENMMTWFVFNHDSHATLLLLGGADWIHRAMNLNNILLLYPTHGKLNSESVTSEIRLTAKVFVLEEQQPMKKPTNSSNFLQMGASKCSTFVKRANLVNGGRYTLKTVGCWKRPKNLSKAGTTARVESGGLHLQEPLLQDISTLQGAPVTVVIVKNFIEAIRVGPGGRFLVGYLGKLVTALSESLDFHYNIMEGSSFGVLTPNHSYDGVVGHIERKEGDLGLASLSINHNRKVAIDYTTWIMYHPSLFVTRAPRIIKDPLILFRIYTWQGWCSIAAVLMFAATSLWILWSISCNYSKVSSSQGNNNNFPINGVSMSKRRPPYIEALTAILKAAVYQGTENPPEASPARVIYICSWLVVMIIYAVYNGNLTAFLSIPRVDRPPSTIRELTLYQRALERGLIKENSGPKMTNDLSWLARVDAAIVMGETGAFHNLNTNTEKDGRCKLTYGREDIGKEYAALALPKMSLLKPFFDKKYGLSLLRLIF
ncbi:hypothetical protein SK128_019215 [Halocaridina rubra]|uniref:Ionotropic glutamate receptor C-terminal domain-containing protein n=1 Tax=Halocaridina rubra TaxID=373956 RepID=A0AAN8XVI6_HALRR